MVNAFNILSAALSPAGVAIIAVEAVLLAVLLAVLAALVIKVIALKKLPSDEYSRDSDDSNEIINGNSSETDLDEKAGDNLDGASETDANDESVENVNRDANADKPANLNVVSEADDTDGNDAYETAENTHEIKTVGDTAETEYKTDETEYTTDETAADLTSFNENSERSLEVSVKDAESGEKITFSSKMDAASDENKGYYDQLRCELLSYKGVRSRVTHGGDYFRIPGRQLAKIILIGSTLRLALALDPKDFEYNIYHQRDRGDMQKYAETPMLVKVQSKLGIERAKGLIAVMMEQNGVKKTKPK